jgi:hypothetical protein
VLAFTAADFAIMDWAIKGALWAGNWDASNTVLTTESTTAILFGILNPPSVSSQECQFACATVLLLRPTPLHRWPAESLPIDQDQGSDTMI